MNNYICIHLDATLKASLDWKKEFAAAESAIEQGSKILWKLDFGLFDRLHYPLASQQQFQGLRLAIEHFQAEIWSHLAKGSLGATLFEGNLDDIGNVDFDAIPAWVSERFEQHPITENENDQFLKALFCRDVALDYLKQLASQMPFGVDCFIQPGIAATLSPIEQAIFLNTECYRPLYFLDHNEDLSANIGICLPPITCYIPGTHHHFDAAIKQLISKGLPYRFIAEEALITSIHGLDELYVAPETLSSQGKRMLQGYSVTGGLVHYLG
jgi:hypothetical protein